MVAMTGKQAWSRFASWLNAALAEDERRCGRPFNPSGADEYKLAYDRAMAKFEADLEEPEDEDEDFSFSTKHYPPETERWQPSDDPAARSTCLHEAAHCLVAAVLGVNVHDAEVHSSPTGFYGSAWHTKASTDDMEAAIAAAGQLADIRNSFGECIAGAKVARLSEFQSSHAQAWSTDNSNLDAMARQHERESRRRGQHYDTAETFKRRAFNRATSILREHGKALEAIADHLMQYGTIDGDRVVSYVTQHAPSHYKASAVR